MVVEHNPILVRRYRGDGLESIHRGCWAVVDLDGRVVASAGDVEQLIFARSSSKSLQALGVHGTGAVERFGLTTEQLAVMVSSHNGEAVHEQTVASLLAAIDLDQDILLCGHAAPFDEPNGERRRIRHNCSGKHAGFLAGAQALGQTPRTYLDPEGAIQQAVRGAVVEVAGLRESNWSLAIDGCSAPTFALPLRALAYGIARVTNPRDLAPQRADACRLITDAVALHPELVAGTAPPRFDTALVAASEGRLFAKGGADGVQVIGVVGAGIAFAGKVDDGNARGLLPVAVEVLDRLGHMSPRARDAVSEWVDPVIQNADGLDVGRQRLAPIEA